MGTKEFAVGYFRAVITNSNPFKIQGMKTSKGKRLLNKENNCDMLHILFITLMKNHLQTCMNEQKLRKRLN